VFLNDTFTDAADTPLASHTGETNAAWTVKLGDARISNANRLRGQTNTTHSYYCSGRPASADYYVEAVLYVASSTSGFRCGVLGRYYPPTNSGYSAQYENWGGAARWELASNGVVIGSYAQALTIGQSYTLRLDMVGSTIRVLIDGVERISVTNTEQTLRYRAGITMFGVMTNTTGIHIDSITATSVMATPNILVADGDSITAGLVANTLPWPTQVGTIIGGTWTISNRAVPSQTLADMESDASIEIDGLFGHEYTRAILVCFAGTNDIYGNVDADDTAATTLSRLSTYCTARNAVGWDLVVVTMLPRTVTTGSLPAVQQTHFNSRRAAFNTSVRANYLTYADRLADVALNTTIGEDGDQSDTTYYQDGVHPTNAGAAILASEILAVLGITATEVTGFRAPHLIAPNWQRPAWGTPTWQS
jgi:lysophospholipase L1-like esterase